ncbi:MAG: ABC transporter permease [Bacteroidota bacterium]
MHEPQQQLPWMGRLLDRLCSEKLSEGILGDLAELYDRDREYYGPQRAGRRYAWRALGFVRLTFLKAWSNHSKSGRIMWTNHLKVSWRSLLRHRRYFAINTIGLTLALVCGLFAALFWLDETAYDLQHSEGQQVFRLYKENINQEKGTRVETAETSGLFGPVAMETIPEVESYVRWWHQDAIVSYENTHLELEGWVYTDSTFFDEFNLELVRGNPQTVLDAPFSVVLTETLAHSLFGGTDPVGQSILGNGDVPYTVTGVVEDPPRQQHLLYDVLASYHSTATETLNQSWLNNWVTQATGTYLVLTEGASTALVEDKLKALLDTHLPERSESYFPKLQPLSEVYLHSQDIIYGPEVRKGNARFLWILVGTGLLVLLVAGVNYVNIGLAKISRSVKEVGVRKAIGATRGLIRQRFLIETALQVVLASVLALMLVGILLPQFNQLTGRALPYSLLWQGPLLLGWLAILGLLTLAVGWYPALLVGTYGTTDLLRSHHRNVRIKGLRQLLLVVQYTISIGLIISTLFIHRQTQFLLGKTVRPGAEPVVVLQGGALMEPHLERLVGELEKHSNIQSVSACQATIGSGTFGTRLTIEETTINPALFRVDGHFDEVYNLTMAEGRFLDDDLATDSASVVVNQAFIDYLGWESATNRYLSEGDTASYFPIVGVVEDFHFRSPAQEKVQPALFVLYPANRHNISVQLGSGDTRQTLDFMESLWLAQGTRLPFRYRFVDDWFARQFASERQMLQTGTVFSVLSIVLCLLGLFGLTSLLLEQRRKEISIRKVLGANQQSLALLINRPFLQLAGIGFVVAIPLADWFVQRWVAQFAYPIPLGMGPFVVAGLLALGLSLVTVSVLTLRTARANPASTLKED